MTEVSAWNAVDASNNATPPDGFPEGMQPSAVNDFARMMMGALRREHDRVTAQIGSVAGTINTTTINTTTVNASSTITASGAITGGAINSTGNGSIAGTLTAGAVTTGNIGASGYVQASQLTSTGNINAAGTVTAAYGHFSNAGIDANLTVGGTLTAGVVTATGLGSNVAGLVVNSGAGTEALAVVGGDIGIHNGHTIIPNVDNTCGVGILGYAFSIMNAYGYVTQSDRRVKADIEMVGPGSIELVQRIAPHTYRIPGGGDPQARHWGFIAQEVGEVMRAAGREFGGYVIGDDENRSEGLNYNELIAVLWGAVRELTARLETLEAGGTDV